MKIVVVGLGYVGLSNVILLAQHNDVIGVDIDNNRVTAINNRSPIINDTEINYYLKNKSLSLTASGDLASSIQGADYIIIATPTDYNPVTNSFNTHAVSQVLATLESLATDATIVIKSTVPVGFTEKAKETHQLRNLYFSPEFLREGHALHDNLYPSRIIVGASTENAQNFAKLLAQGAKKQNIPLHFTSSAEAESIKLFSNTYLAMRVAFFNELDSYAMSHDMDSKAIVDGVSQDPRIGHHYNNPSFGYGGYCLPKDTKQLLASYHSVPQNLIQATVDSNVTRAHFIVNDLKKKEPKNIGVYRLTMKTDSDNFRQSSVKSIINELKLQNFNITIYEPNTELETLLDCPIITNLDEFKANSDLILANRWADDLRDVQEKVYTRDLYGRD